MAGLVSGTQLCVEEAALQDEAEARASLVLALRRRGVGARDVLAAIERVPRRLFLAARYHRLAYEDAALPIECGQTVLSPSMVAFAVQALKVEPGHAVLEIGCGSGYQAAILANIANRVETLDRYATLVDLAERRFAALKLSNVKAHHADGLKGLKTKGPFDRIIATASVESIPDAWVEQLKPDGFLVAPVGKAAQPQTLIRFQKLDGVGSAENLTVVRTVMLRPELAKNL
ncbi:protein-L-isoaspartate(D-aspartate) O-methyltransferase [Roseibium denhamense]|uniref:Protein-L-isoaspartate O-methyltransferase n=1 Tax=Roseibium denhamense TaxID=76305 RepID=A0ABY1PEA0_9HYPH|nr:protein-L-isoaspartate(D-aspartate) O-methyltransferase [Roseibium denhamense]MTI06158.1 protein-L-isoaspartate(D-aspartate) O-methyltransferase [Roseibium denhamense]SMP32309.1 protein-L-isoaspartate(D-aspartate) O-methyltransferase [Roseibium denhamense]